MLRLKRAKLIQALHQCFTQKKYSLIICYADDWLSQFPGDLDVEFLKAKALSKAGDLEESSRILKKLVQLDCMHKEAIEYLLILGENPGRVTDLQTQALASLQKQLDSGGAGTTRFSEQLQACRKQWPNCLNFLVVEAIHLYDNGQISAALELAHEIAARDLSGQTVKRLILDSHPLAQLWGNDFEGYVSTPFPAEISTTLGLNLLPDARSLAGVLGQKAATPKIHEKNVKIKGCETFVVVFISRKSEVLKKWGSQGDSQIITAVQHSNEYLRTQETRKNFRFESMLFWIDDPGVGAKAPNPTDTFSGEIVRKKILAVHDELKNEGKTIHSLIILGGPEVIPFYKLQNPVFDDDASIFSDAPYSTSEENFLVSEWTVSRIPELPDKGVSYFVQMILNTFGSALAEPRPKTTLHLMALVKKWLENFLSFFFTKPKYSLAITAVTWLKQSQKVFDVIGTSNNLFTSPPLQSGIFIPGKRTDWWRGHFFGAGLMYFNLHGLPDDTSWFGQTPPFSEEYPDEYPDYPEAVRLGDVADLNPVPNIVFSEACYGARLQTSQTPPALSQMFLHVGTQAFVGSTARSYGSEHGSLIGADYLASSFWKWIQKGYPAGEALRLAKLNMAKDLERKQGFLDEIDQKTILSFVLYGNPFARIGKDKKVLAKGVVRPGFANWKPKTVCEKAQRSEGLIFSREEEEKIRSLLSKSFPMMRNAEIYNSQKHREKCNKECQFCQLSLKNGLSQKTLNMGQKSLTLHKTIESKGKRHSHFARVSIGIDGQITKISLSK